MISVDRDRGWKKWTPDKEMPFISFLMTVKNVERYIPEAIQSVRAQRLQAWELVIVNDHSDDRTGEVVEALQESDTRIRVFQNPGRGQVQALNYGYSKTNGGFIKLLDGDDALSPSLSDWIGALTFADAAYHDLDVVDGHLRKMNTLRMTSKFKDSPLASHFKGGTVHPPRASWTISRRIGDRVFPLPSSLPSPHEDFWMALVIKKYSGSIHYIPESLYLYRQHPGQVFGGIHNFAPEIVRFRAQAMVEVIRMIEEEENGGIISEGIEDFPKLIDPMKRYYVLLAREDIGLTEVLRAGLPLLESMKLLTIKKCPWLASFISKHKSRLSSKFLHKLK